MFKRIGAIALAAALGLSVTAIPAGAVSDQAQALVDEYAGSLYLTGEEEEALFSIYTYLTDTLGMNTAAAAGVAANVYAECSFNVSDDNGVALGIVQWTGSNRTGIINWCQENGYDAWSLSGQLTYLTYQLQNVSWYSNVNWTMENCIENSSEGAAYAGWYWCYYYEIPADRDGQASYRSQLAQNVFYPVFAQLEGLDVELTFTDVGAAPYVFPFTDVSEEDWYYDAIYYVAQKGMFAGVADGTFAPDMTMTRAQLLQALYALEGSPAVSGRSSFTDISSDDWYYNAALWAEQTGLFTEFESIADMWTEDDEKEDTCLHPDDLIDREQLAVWLFNYYALYKGNAAANFNELDGYADMESLTYGTDAMRWAVGNGVISGGMEEDGQMYLNAQTPCTRAEVAVMLTALLKNLM